MIMHDVHQDRVSVWHALGDAHLVGILSQHLRIALKAHPILGSTDFQVLHDAGRVFLMLPNTGGGRLRVRGARRCARRPSTFENVFHR